MPKQKSPLRLKGLILFLTALFCLFGIWLSAQIVAVFHDIAALPPWLRWPGYAAISVMLGIVIFAFTRFVILYFHLRRNRQISITGLKELQERQNLHELAQGQARSHLTAYLHGYSIEGREEALRKIGFSNEEIEDLQLQKKALLTPEEVIDDDRWIEEFRDSFQQILQRCAERRIKEASIRTGVQTAISPNGFVDSMIVIYLAFLLIGDLCRIYNLRAGHVATAWIMAKAFFHAYLAGEMQETLDKTIQWMSSELRGNWLVRSFVSKSAEALANGIVLWRLGRSTSRILAPVCR